MKESTRLLIESGIIPESVVALCRIWGGESTDLSEIDAAMNRSQTQEELVAVVQKVAELLERDALPEIKETEPDLESCFSKTRIKATQRWRTRGEQEVETSAYVGFTSLGKMIVKVIGPHGRGAAAQFSTPDRVVYVKDGRVLKILHAEPRYQGDDLSFIVCDVESYNA
jgi:hypothetical protein